ncbi:MAG TPA: plastocyanin/azurin family copper-binding protein [Thermoleophilaceae bacterium]
MKRTILAATAAFVLAMCAGAPAQAATETRSFDYPVTLGPYQVKQDFSFVASPGVDAFITRMSVDVVDADGRPVPIRRVMLHHIVFASLGRPSRTCGSTPYTAFDSKTTVPNLGESFYGAGEEHNVLNLPPGYGYRITKEESWAMVWMLMNHRGVDDDVRIRWTVTWDDSPDITELHPYWLDVRNCRADPVYDVPGGGKRGSSHSETFEYTMPESGRIVSAGAHVHGGARDLTVSQPDCGDRAVFRSQPAWGMPDHPFYHVRPILHEPGPISMSGLYSQKGYPVERGQRIRLTSRYDNFLPHTRVMGIVGMYLAPQEVPPGCSQPPDDIATIQPAQAAGIPFRTDTPAFRVPITGIGRDGRARAIKRPPGRTVRVKSGATVNVRNFSFAKPNLSLAKGSTLDWRFGPDTLHNVTLANGPRGFSSDNLSDGRRFSYRFDKPGTYRLFCGLHPVQMTQTVKVRRKRR